MSTTAEYPVEPIPDQNTEILMLLHKMDQRLDRLEALVTQVPALTATVTDTVDVTLERMRDAGVDVDERLWALVPLLERISRPQTLNALQTLADQAEALPAMASMVADTADSMIAQMQAQGIDIDARMRSTLTAAEVLSRPETVALLHDVLSRSEELSVLTNVLLESGIFKPDAAEMVGNAGAALVAARSEPSQPVGFFGLLRSFLDTDVQRAAAFAVRFARRFGKNLPR